MNTSLTSGGLKVCHLPPCLSRGGGHLQNICIKALGEWTEGVPQKASRSPAPGLRTETRRLSRRGADGHLCHLFSPVRPAPRSEGQHAECQRGTGETLALCGTK